MNLNELKKLLYHSNSKIVENQVLSLDKRTTEDKESLVSNCKINNRSVVIKTDHLVDELELLSFKKIDATHFELYGIKFRVVSSCSDQHNASFYSYLREKDSLNNKPYYFILSKHKKSMNAMLVSIEKESMGKEIVDEKSLNLQDASAMYDFFKNLCHRKNYLLVKKDDEVMSLVRSSLLNPSRVTSQSFFVNNEIYKHDKLKIIEVKHFGKDTEEWSTYYKMKASSRDFKHYVYPIEISKHEQMELLTAMGLSVEKRLEYLKK